MSWHRSPGGRHVHPRAEMLPGAPADHARATPVPARTVAGALRHGLSAAAVVGGLLAVAVPTAATGTPGSDPAPSGAVGPPDRGATVLGLAAGVLRAAQARAAPGPVVVAALLPVVEPAPPPPGFDMSALLKAAGLADVDARAAEAQRAQVLAAQVAERERIAVEQAARDRVAQCEADLGGLGRVKPWVRDAAQFLSCLNDHPELIGVAQRSRRSDHPRGLALDLLARGAQGDRIAECALANRDELGVAYVIWEQRVNYGDGWEPMSDRGGVTENHFDHVHISFTPTAPGTAPTPCL